MWESLTQSVLRLGLRKLPIDIEMQLQSILESRQLSAETMILGYINGFFPMGNESGGLGWRCPPQRGIIPIDEYRIPRNVKRLMRQQRFEIRVNTAFEATLKECQSREESWISPELADIYAELNHRGLITTVEAWQDDQLVASIFGTTIGSYYSGESQFSKVADAGKVAMVHLMKGLRCGGFLLHDAQYVTDYLKRYGAFDIPRDEYRQQLLNAIASPAQFELPSEEINNPDESTRTKSESPAKPAPRKKVIEGAAVLS